MKDSGNSRLNNFDFLRIAAAFFVLISHQYALYGLPEPSIFGMSLGTFGVLVFFSISGFLVSQSWRQDPHIGHFLAKRFLRIWPGLAVVTLIAAVVLGPAVSTFDWRTYFYRPEFLDYLRNLKVVTIRYFLPGVFEDNIYPRAVNGSLWTIPLEVRCYFALLLAGCIGLTKRPPLVFLIVVACAIYYFAFAPNPQNHQYHFALYFFAGVCLDLFRQNWTSKPIFLLGAVTTLAAVFYLLDANQVALLLLIPAYTIYIGISSTHILNKAGRYGDISYGIYIYAFPVQQTVLWAVGKNFPFISGLLITSSITTLCAFLSWHLIEKQALGLKAYLSGGSKNMHIAQTS